MNTNNKEALELLDKAFHLSNNIEVRKRICQAVGLLQDNEDTEVKEEPLLQNNPGHEHLPSGVGKGAYCVGCLEELDKPSAEVQEEACMHSWMVSGDLRRRYCDKCDKYESLVSKPSSKVEKLKELEERLYKECPAGVFWAFRELLEILIEDEE